LIIDDRNFLSTSDLMCIKNDRNKEDQAGLYGEKNQWKGMRSGITK
jgi:hypothetical protein